MTSNRMNGLIFMMILMETAGQIVLHPPDCSSVCGLKEISDANCLHVSKWSLGITLDNSSVCVENAIEPIVAWNRSAREFMRYIGMNDEKFGCPMENSFTEVSSGLYPMLEKNPHLSFYQSDEDTESIASVGQKNLPLEYLMLEKYLWKNLTTFLVIVLSLVIAELFDDHQKINSSQTG